MGWERFLLWEYKVRGSIYSQAHQKYRFPLIRSIDSRSSEVLNSAHQKWCLIFVSGTR